MTSAMDLSRAIEHLVHGWWNEKQVPLLLSKLGSLLPSELQVWIRTERVALKRFIQEELSSRIRLLDFPRQGGGVVPFQETQGVSEKELEEAFERQRLAHIENKIPRYHVLIWDAFRTPLIDGHRRFVRVGDNGEIEVKEIGSNSEPPTEKGWIEVTQEHLQHLSEYGSPAPGEVDNAIKGWADGKFEPDKLFQRAREVQLRSPSHSRNRTRVGSLESIVLGLRGFTTDELARIQIPGDVLLSVLERNSRS
jgi:hypothetical protein